MKTKLILTSLLLNVLLFNPSYGQDGPGGGQPGGGQPGGGQPGGGQPGGGQPQDAEQRLQGIIAQRNITPVNTSNLNILDVNDVKVQLGKQLFFTKNLGGEQSAACVSCHHPSLGGGDNLSLSVGINAVDQLDTQSHNLLGHGRFNGNDNFPVVPRNAPTIFNIALYPRGLFWDSRVERLRNGAIVTPDSVIDTQGRRLPDSNLPADANIVNAQARFPVTSKEEMRGGFESTSDNQNLRSALVARLNNDIANISSVWPSEFAKVYGDDNVTTDRVFEAIGEYERSMLFVNNSWQAYLAGDSTALSEQQKQGAVLFFAPRNQGGAGCVTCHNGSNFTDSRHHLVAFPQIGVGKGNSSASSETDNQDFGRENITQNSNDKFHFRTPSLLNVEATAPYGHSGAYQTLEEVVAHYNNPSAAIDRLFAASGGQAFNNGIADYCQLPQIAGLMEKSNQNCENIFPDAYLNSVEVTQFLDAARGNRNNANSPLRARANLSQAQVSQVAGFLRSLTDPCIENRDCLAPWIIDENDVATFPDDQPLVATDQNDNAL